MSSPTDILDRIAPTRRPNGSAIGYQTWTNLLFVHWRVPAQVIRPLIPESLDLDLWDGDAWIGLVPFHMSGVRPWWSPAVPGVSEFHETNVRTYVHFRGHDPGVWFFSLDASNSLAVKIARWRWQLPYYRSDMQIRLDGSRVTYVSRRLWPEPSGVGLAITAEIPDLDPLHQNGSALSHAASGEYQSAPGSLEHFLLERYILYTRSNDAGLLAGQVHHTPYPTQPAELVEFKDSLVAAAGIPLDTDPCHVAFSRGVEVEIFPLFPVRDG